jgi:tetratricopeptide (TPR) repeat protein
MPPRRSQTRKKMEPATATARAIWRAFERADLAEAVRAAKHLTTQLPSSAFAWAQYGEMLSIHSKHPAARRAFARATRLDPESSLAWFGLAESWAAERGQKAAALLHLRRALQCFLYEQDTMQGCLASIESWLRLDAAAMKGVRTAIASGDRIAADAAVAALTPRGRAMNKRAGDKPRPHRRAAEIRRRSGGRPFSGRPSPSNRP